MTDTTFLCITLASTQNNSPWAGMPYVPPKHKQLTTVQYINPKEKKHLINNRHENLTTSNLNSLQAGRSVNEIPVGRDFAHPSRPTLGCWVFFSGVKQAGHGIDHPLHLVPRSKIKSTVIPPLALWGFMASSSVNLLYFLQFGILHICLGIFS